MATYEWVREFLDYEPETGHFYWKRRPSNRVAIGQRAGEIISYGYHVIGIQGEVFKNARIAWLWMTGEWPNKYVDHINGNRADDRWANLRLASHSQNLTNRGKQVNNTSGYKGVYLHKQTGKWRARIKHNGDHISLGLHETRESAYQAYCLANINLNGEFARN